MPLMAYPHRARLRTVRQIARLPLSCLMCLLLAASALGVVRAQEPEFETIEPGKLTVAFNGDMPMTGLEDGQLIGTDGEMIALIAERLGLEIAPQQMDWAAVIESTTSGRVDLMLGAMGWTIERSEAMLLTDPIYYFGTFLAQKADTNWHTIADMAGKRLGTVQGFSVIPEMKAIPGAAEVRLYDTSDAVLRDLVAGRIDIAIIDPPLTAAAIKQHPEWNLHQLPLDPDPAYPHLSTKHNVVMGINQEATALYEAINAEVGQLWATCTNQAIMAEYGVTDLSFFQPPEVSPRLGVDRPEDWPSPTLAESCAQAPSTPAP